MNDPLERLNAIAYYYGFPRLRRFTEPRPPINFYRIKSQKTALSETSEGLDSTLKPDA